MGRIARAASSRDHSPHTTLLQPAFMPMMRRASLAAALSLALAWPATGQTQSVREWSRAHEHAILREYVDFLAIPNVASDRENIRRNAAHIMAMMERRGLRPRLLEAADSTAPPSVYG